jgi:hypothetical protein
VVEMLASVIGIALAHPSAGKEQETTGVSPPSA